MEHFDFASFNQDSKESISKETKFKGLSSDCVIGGRISNKVKLFTQLCDRDQTLFLSLKEYFASNDFIQKNMLRFLPEGSQGDGNGDSMRMFNFLFTRYTEEVCPVHLLVNDSMIFDLFAMYKSEMSLNRKRFDPFRRGDTILWPLNDGTNRFVETTLGQLNFLKFASRWNLIEYVEANKDTLMACIRKSDTEKRRTQILGMGVLKKKSRKRKNERASFKTVMHSVQSSTIVPISVGTTTTTTTAAASTQ